MNELSELLESMPGDIFDVESETVVHFDVQEVNSFFDHFSRFDFDQFFKLTAVPVEIEIGFFQNVIFFLTPHQILILVGVVLINCIQIWIVVKPVHNFVRRAVLDWD